MPDTKTILAMAESRKLDMLEVLVEIRLLETFFPGEPEQKCVTCNQALKCRERLLSWDECSACYRDREALSPS